MSLITYKEDKLPDDVRAGIKCTYYDWDIILVEEIHTNEGFEYIVIMRRQIKHQGFKSEQRRPDGRIAGSEKTKQVSYRCGPGPASD